MSNETLLQLGTFAAAIGAAWLSFLSLKKGGERRIAEFRREWIEDLRQHLASILSINSGLKTEPTEDDWRQTVLHTEMILLMLNATEDSHNSLSECVQRIARQEFSPENFANLRQSAREVMKAEWEKVKSETKMRKLLPWH